MAKFVNHPVMSEESIVNFYRVISTRPVSFESFNVFEMLIQKVVCSIVIDRH